MRAVRFDRYGDVSVLHIDEVPVPVPGPGQVVVRVRVAGVNTGEIGIRDGSMQEMAPAHFPEGQGTECSGVVHAVGDGVRDHAIGDPVIGLADDRGTQADFAVVGADGLVAKPEAMGWEVAAAMPSAGGTATSIMRALAPKPHETLVVAGASGPVGLVVLQLAAAAGARVVATADRRNHAVLRGFGAEPVEYGDGVEGRIRALAPDGVDAFADCHGDGNVDLAVRLGVPVDRINTIKDFPAAKRVGCRTQGLYQLDDIAAAVRSVVALVDAGRVQMPIKASYPLEQVQDAYRRLAEHGIGKVVLAVSGDGDRP